MDRITCAPCSAREPVAAVISRMDNPDAAAIHTGFARLGHEYDAVVVQAPDDNITTSDIFQALFG